MKFRFVFFIIGIIFLGYSCNTKEKEVFNNTDVIHQIEHELTEVIIHDVFTPPVASRIYAYTSLAAFEAIRFLEPGNESLVEKMNGFNVMPIPEDDKQYDYTLAAVKAFFDVAKKVTFSVDRLNEIETNVLKKYENILDDVVVANSLAFGTSVSKVILERAVQDNYLQSRGKKKYLGSNTPGKWRPTQPDYLDGVEWCWNEMHPLLMDSVSQFLPGPPIPYSSDTNSVYFNALKEVYQISQNLSEEQKTIAKYWDDNPFVIEHSGHLMFGSKKITPGGHWMGIAAIAAKKTNANEVKTARTFALTGVALFEGFISSWDAKYKWEYVRPVTVINDVIEKTWSPLLQTPPFPEYTSAHSTITASAAKVLTKLYGENFAFLDTSDLKYIGMQRHFDSFLQAAQECSISRVYGGIHYRMSVDSGNVCGKRIGDFIINKLKL